MEKGIEHDRGLRLNIVKQDDAPLLGLDGRQRLDQQLVRVWRGVVLGDDVGVKRGQAHPLHGLSQLLARLQEREPEERHGRAATGGLHHGAVSALDVVDGLLERDSARCA